MKLFPFVSALLVLISCSDPDEHKFTVEGSLSNMPPTTIYLEQTDPANQPMIVDSAQVAKDGTFTLSANNSEQTIYTLRLKNSDPFAYLVNDSKKLNVEIDGNQSGASYSVKGSESSEALRENISSSNQKLSVIYAYSRQIDSLYAAKNDSLAMVVEEKQNEEISEFKEYITKFINQSKSGAAILFVLGNYQMAASNPALGLDPFTDQQVRDIIEKSAKKFPDHKTLAALNKNIGAGSDQKAGSMVNKQAPAFSLPDPSGKEISLESFRGKYVLVDFWASWCRPCRVENPNVVRAYQQFRDKNFTVLGVSLDKDREDWIKAIQADKLTWAHASDLGHWQSQVVPLYGVQSIPYNVLVDPDGKIIAENLRGAGLSRKLKEVLE